jgi:hypothetical protein
MRTLAHLLLAAALAASLPACVTTKLTPDAEAVRVVSDAQAVTGCTYVAEVEGGDSMNGGLLGQGAAEENAYRRLKNAAAKAGANTVLLATSRTGTSGSKYRGAAYTCPRPT